MSTRAVIARRWVLLLSVLLAIVWFGNLEHRALVRPDEGRYSEIPREMVATGDWVTPRLNGLKYFYKPALQYWATAIAYEAFGEHHWTARLWPALTGFLGALFTGWVGARLWGRNAGLIAGAVTASGLFYLAIGHLVTLDMGLTFFLNAGVLALVMAQRAEASERDTRDWMLFGWACLALAILSKGLIGGALPGAALFLYVLLNRDWAVLKKLHIINGTLLLLAICAPWFIWVSLRNPEFAHYFFIHEHFERFLTKVHARYKPWYYFIPILLAGMLPWTGLMLDALLRAWRRQSASGFQVQRFLFIWCVFVYVFFSLSSSKLPSYILPVFPALGLLIAHRVVNMSPRTLAWHAVPFFLLGVVGAVLAPGAVRFADTEVPLPLYQAYVPWLIASGVFLALGSAACFWFAWRGRVVAASIMFAIGGLLAGQCIVSGHNSLSPSNSAYHLVKKFKPVVDAAGPNVPVYSYMMYEQTIPFYLKRTVTLVRYRDEMGFGIDQEPHKAIKTDAEFIARWKADRAAFAIVREESLSFFNTHQLPYEIIARDTRRIILKKL
jgi:4-amino-4-deoxy-L-arabinose transferase-like glycosyltransferase